MKTLTPEIIEKTIAGLSLFADCRALAGRCVTDGRCEIRRFAPGDVLSEPHTPVSALGIVADGRIGVYADGAEKGALLRTMGPGKVFGVVGLTDGGDHVSRILAVQPTDVIFIPADTIRKMLAEDTRFMRNYLAFLSDRIRFLNRKIAYLSVSDATDRVLAYLRSLLPSDAIFPCAVTPDYSFTDLSDLLNLGRASLYRAFDNLADEGVITRQGRTVILEKGTR